MAEEALALLEVDALGLDELDRQILRRLAETFEGRPVGLGTLADSVGEAADTIEDVYEPYLLQEGLLKRTPRGRVATAARVPPPRPAPAGRHGPAGPVLRRPGGAGPAGRVGRWRRPSAT